MGWCSVVTEACPRNVENVLILLERYTNVFFSIDLILKQVILRTQISYLAAAVARNTAASLEAHR